MSVFIFFLIQGLVLDDQYHLIILDEDVRHYKYELTIYTVSIGVIGLLCLSTTYCFNFKSKEEIKMIKKGPQGGKDDDAQDSKRKLALRGSY